MTVYLTLTIVWTIYMFAERELGSVNCQPLLSQITAVNILLAPFTFTYSVLYGALNTRFDQLGTMLDNSWVLRYA